jgi:peptide/nickel transport system substrate-binding protein
MQLSANPHWWGGKVPIQHITINIFSSETSEALAMRAGEIDVAFPLNGPPFASASGGTVLNWPAANDVGIFAMNTRLKPWSDIHVRRAVAYALNRTDIITADGGPTSAGPDSTLISTQELRLLGSESHVNALLKSLPRYAFNLTKARQEMAESPYPKSFTTTTETRNFGGWVDICEVIAAELQKIGIKMKVDVLPSETWLTDIFGPRTYGNVFTYWGAGNPDPGAEPGSLLGSENMKIGGGDLANYDPKSVDQLLARGDATSNPAARLAIYGDLLKKLATDEPYVPLFNINIFMALGSKFTLPASVRNQYVTHVFADWPFLVKPAA